MSDTDTLAVVFESGVVRFDDEGVLHVHLPHSAADPHPLLVHGLEAGISLPPDATDAVVQGGPGERAWRPRSSLPEVDDLPDGIVLSFKDFDWAQVEMSGDLTVFLREPTDLPSWVRAGHVHRFAREGLNVKMWVDSAAPPAVAPKVQESLEEPMGDWKQEHAAPAPERSGRWVGGAQQTRAPSPGCATSVVLLGAGLFLAQQLVALV